MGYDMHVRPRPPFGARPADYYESANYLRRNIFGMWPTVEAMHGLGMAFSSPAPEFPTAPEPYDEHVDWDDEKARNVPVTEAGRRYLDLVAETLTTHGECRTPGIPDHKFSTNDGWHVTSEECQQALDAYGKAMANGDPHPELFRDDLIPFLRTAAAADGFEVW